jgi:hypothetical protein
MRARTTYTLEAEREGDTSYCDGDNEKRARTTYILQV